MFLLAAGAAYGQPAAPANLAATHALAWDLVPDCVCTYEVSIDGAPLVPPFPQNTITFPDPMRPGVHTVTVVAIDDQGRRSAPSTVGFLETLVPAPSKPCTYIAPGSTVTEQRPIGQPLQGFNPIGPSGTTGNQAERLTLLETWGWTPLVNQFVDGSVRPDKLDRLFLLLKCAGLP